MNYLTVKLVNKIDNSYVNYFINKEYTSDRAKEMFDHARNYIRKEIIADGKDTKDYKVIPEIKSYKEISKEGINNYKFIEPAASVRSPALPIFDLFKEAKKF